VGSTNLLQDGGFRNGIDGSVWLFNQNGDTTATTQTWETNPDWCLRDGDVDDWDGVGAPYGSSVSIRSTSAIANFPYIYQRNIPVTGAETYSVSVLVGNHRCSAIDVAILWYDTDGAYISGSYAPSYSGGAVGGPSIDGWYRMKNEGVVAPSSAVKASLALFLSAPLTSASDCYAFFDQAWFGVGAYAREFDPQEAGRVRNSDGNVLIDSSGVTVTNGRITVANAGSTVIIDGTSNMFKIAATGTLTTTESVGAGGYAISGAVLSGLGAQSTVNAHLSYITVDLADTSYRYIGRMLEMYGVFVAPVSGASPTFNVSASRSSAEAIMCLDSNQYPYPALYVINRTGASRTYYSRYYVFVEAAI
jgi:hypothetical protein